MLYSQNYLAATNIVVEHVSSIVNARAKTLKPPHDWEFRANAHRAAGSPDTLVIFADLICRDLIGIGRGFATNSHSIDLCNAGKHTDAILEGIVDTLLEELIEFQEKPDG